MVVLPKSRHHLQKCLLGNSDNLGVVALAEAVVGVAALATEEAATFLVGEVMPEAATRTPAEVTLSPAEATKPTKTEEATTITLRKVSIALVVSITNSTITEGAMEVTKETLMTTEVVMVTTIGVVSTMTEVVVEGATTMTEVAVEGATTTIGVVAEVVIVRKIFNNRNGLKLMILFKLRRPPTPTSTFKRGSTINSIPPGAMTGILEAAAGRITIEEVEVVTVNFID